MTKLQERRAALKAERDALAGLYREGGGSANLDLGKITGLGDLKDAQKLDELRERAEKIDAMSTECEQLAAVERDAKRLEIEDAKREERERTGSPEADPKRGPAKSLGKAIVDSGVIKAALAGESFKADLADVDPAQLKATFTEGASYDPESLRQQGLLTIFGFQEPMIYDAIPMSQTMYLAVKYMEQTTRTNAAAERAENTLYAESEYVYTEREEVVRSIGHRLPVTDEILEDEPWIESVLNMDLLTDLRRRVSSQLINGNGAAPNIRGILHKAGIATQAKGADSLLDAIHKGLTVAEVGGFCMPNLVILHPNDWAVIRRSKTTDGDYLFGSPAMTGAMNVWGLPRVKTQEIAVNSALVGDTMYCTHAVRRGVQVEVGYHDTDFGMGRKTIRVGMRCAMVVRRAAAFCQVTS